MTTDQPSTSAAAIEHEAGRLDQAERIYRARLAQFPNDVATLIGLGDVLTDSRQLAEAEEIYRRAIALDSESQLASGAFDGLAAILQDTGDLDGAVAASKKAAVLRGSAEDAFGVGNSLEYLGRIGDAIEMFELAAKLQHGYTEAHAKAALHLMNTGQPAAAVPHYQAAVQARPEVAELHCNLATAQQQAGESNEALNAARTAIELKPQLPEAHNVMGAIWKERGRWNDALGALGRAVKLRPDYADALNNTGTVLQSIARAEEAAPYFDKAISARPDVPAFHINLAINRLMRGDYQMGFAEFEWRRRDPHNSASRAFPQPEWRGQPLGEHTLLIHAEMPISLTVLFLRYIEFVRQRTGIQAKIVLEIQPALADIARRVPGVHAVVEQGNPLPEFHLHCPLLSMANVFSTMVQTVPVNVPYIIANPERVAKFAGKFTDTKGKRKIGIGWAESSNKRDRLCPTAKLTALAGIEGLAFFNLDKPALPAELNAVDFAAEITDLSDTVALIEQMDVVIAADTVVAHLSAAMGKKTVVVLNEAPDWCWLLNRADSPWYPTAKLFRQSASQGWSDVVAAVVKILSEGVLA